MKDASKKVLQSSRPQVDAYTAIDFCLQQLFKDKTKKLADKVAGCCTYEELIGALLQGRDLAGRYATVEYWETNDE
jgi:hypothetical protein